MCLEPTDCVFRSKWTPPGKTPKTETWHNETVLAYFSAWEMRRKEYFIPPKCRETLTTIGKDFFW